MSRVKAGQASTLVVTHTDRLARFGFDYLAHTFSGRLHGLRRYEKQPKTGDLTGGVV